MTKEKLTRGKAMEKELDIKITPIDWKARYKESEKQRGKLLDVLEEISDRNCELRKRIAKLENA